MIALGYVICAVLSVLALVSSVSAATKIGLRPGAELSLGASVLWFAVILAPIHLLGVLGLLWPITLAPASLVTSALVFFASTYGQKPAEQLAATSSAARETLERVRSLLVLAFQAGPLTIAAVAAIVLALVWTALLTYVLPSDAWDGVWYHDLAVGYALQQHGYSEVALPAGGFQQAIGYPRNGEMTSLWFVIFADRKLLELPSVLAAIPLSLSTYCLCQRYGERARLASLLWAVAFVLLPGARLLMRTTYIDLQFAALTLAAFYFASDPNPSTGGRSIMASVAIGLTLGSKGQAVLTVPFLIIIALAFLGWNQGRKKLRRTASFAALGGIIIVVLGGVSYIQNLIRHHNPIWPIATKVGPFDLQGTMPFGVFLDSGPTDLVQTLLSIPQPGHDYADTRIFGYGLFGFFVFPFAALAAIGVCFAALRLLLLSIVERRPQPEMGRILSLLAILAVICISTWKAPQIWLARYNLAAVGITIVLVHWLSHRFPRSRAFTFGAATAAFITNVMLWWWSDPGWTSKGIVDGMTEMKQLLRGTVVERARASALHNADMVAARERELGPGDIVVWTEQCNFPSLLWNERYTNILLYLPATTPPTTLLDEAERVDARWLVVAGPWADAARARRERWTEVGVTHQHHSPNAIFRRSI